MSENIPHFNFEEFSRTLELKRKLAKRKAIVFTIFPIVVSVILFGYCAASVHSYEKRVETLTDSAQKLSLEATMYDSLIKVKEKRVQELDTVLNQVLDSANLNIKRTDIAGADSTFVTAIAKYAPAIVYIQVANLDGKRLEPFKKKIQSLGYIVPAVELMSNDDYPNHIQFYYPEDSIAARRVLEKCQEVYPEKTFTEDLYTGKKYKGSKGQIEVWIKNQ
jgi:hypothetical protein